LRYGLIGTFLGFSVALIGVALINMTKLFGADMPNIVYYAIIAFFTLFGAWEGGLLGIGSKNKKIALFDDDLQSGKYLILIYVKSASESMVRESMNKQHPEAELVAVDSSFYNPLADLERV